MKSTNSSSIVLNESMLTIFLIGFPNVSKLTITGTPSFMKVSTFPITEGLYSLSPMFEIIPLPCFEIKYNLFA